MDIIASHPQKRDFRLRAVSQIMGNIRLEISKIQSIQPAGESSYPAMMSNRLRTLELESLQAANRQLIKETSALRRNSPDTDDLPTTAGDGLA